MNTINYGFGKEYLPKWSINEALREIYQNYIDYGIYTIKVVNIRNNKVRVHLSNDYKPNKLEFLRIGNSDKGGNANAIGHHGEGLKMAFLIFLRHDLYIQITTNKFILYPRFKHDDNVGDTLEITYIEHGSNINKFITTFECDKDIYDTFINNIIKKEDIIFEDTYHGKIVDKSKGNIYSGGLFVCNLPNVSKSYDINPCNLELDRDRCLPRAWDISYHTSKLNEKHQWKHEDTSYSDTEYIEKVSIEKANEYKQILIEGKREYIHKETKSLLHNSNIKSALNKIIKPIKINRKSIIKDKELKAKRKGVITLIREFKKKYVNNIDAIEDINIIIKKLKLK